MAEALIDEIWVCTDCHIVAGTGDLTGLQYSYTDEEIEDFLRRHDEGVDRIMGDAPPGHRHLLPDHDVETGEGYDEFRADRCDVCRRPHSAGERHRYHVVGH